MKRKPGWYGLMLLLAACAVLLPAAARAGKGVDRGKVKTQQLVYPATLTIGGMSFRGQVSRMDKLTDEEIEKIIKDALKDAKMTELEVSEAQDTVDRVAKEEELTPEDVDRVMDNIMKLAGVDNVADVIRAIGNTSAEDFAVSLGGFAADEAKEKALAWILEQAEEGAGDAAGPITKILDMILISADQYALDKQKWKDRVDAANAQRKLNKLYDYIKEMMDNAAGARSRGWSLWIKDTDRRNFTFYGVAGNLETWTVLMILKKPDAGEDVSAGGKYTGSVSIIVEYEMSVFDEGFKNSELSGAKFFAESFKSAAGNLTVTVDKPKDDYAKTKISRNLDSADFSLAVTVPSGSGSVRTAVDFSGFKDDKQISIRHKVTLKSAMSGNGNNVKTVHVLEFATENEEKLTRTADYNATNLGVNANAAVSDTVAWDSAIWEQWEKEKWLEITHPQARE